MKSTTKTDSDLSNALQKRLEKDMREKENMLSFGHGACITAFVSSGVSTSAVNTCKDTRLKRWFPIRFIFRLAITEELDLFNHE